MRKRRQTIGVLVVGALIATACGAPDNEVVIDAIVTQPTSTTLAPATSVASSNPSVVQIDAASLLTDVTASAPTPAGWVLPVGVWTTSALGVPFTFETTLEMELRDVGDGIVRLANRSPDGTGSQAFVSILAPTGVVVPPPSAAVPVDFEPVPIDFGRWLGDSDFVVVDRGTPDAGAGRLEWWEIEVAAGPKQPYVCELGPACHGLLRTGADQIVNAGGSESVANRVYRLTGDTGDVFVVVSSLASIAPGLFGEVETLLGSATFAAPDPYPSGEVEFLRSLLDVDGVAPGSYIARAGNAVMEFDVDATVPGVTVAAASADGFSFASSTGALVFTAPVGLVAPGAAQFDGVPAASDLLVGVDDFGAWAEASFTIDQQGTIQLGDITAPWWDVSLMADGAGYACASPIGVAGQCVNAVANSTGLVVVSDWATTRFIYVESEGLLIVATSGDSIEAWMDTVSDLLDDLVVRD